MAAELFAFLCVCGLSGRSSDRQTKQLEPTADTALVQIPREGFDRAFTSLTYTTQAYMHKWLADTTCIAYLYLSISCLPTLRVFIVILLTQSNCCVLWLTVLPFKYWISPLGSINLSEIRWSGFANQILANLLESMWNYNVLLTLQLLSEIWVHRVWVNGIAFVQLR